MEWKRSMSLYIDNIILSCTDEIIFYVENLKDCTQNFRTNEFSKVAGYKIYRDLLHFFTLKMKYQKK